jgi:hypothetical protein
MKLIFGLILAGALAWPVTAMAETFNVFVSNDLSQTVRLSVDGQFVCEMKPEGSCMVPIPDGTHVIAADLGNGQVSEYTTTNPGGSLHMSVSEEGLGSW